MYKYIWGGIVASVGIIGSIASTFGSNIWLKVGFVGVVFLGFIILIVTFIKNRWKPAEKVEPSKHLGFSVSEKLVKKCKNSDVAISRLIKNVKYSNNNKTSNVTYIIDGNVTSGVCKGLYIPISAASPTSNISRIGYSLILEEKDMIIDDDFHFIDNLNIQKLLRFNVGHDEVLIDDPHGKILFLRFVPTHLAKGDKFQVVLYYTWINAIIGKTDSTYYFTRSLFPNGVKKLVTNLVFTSAPLQASVYKVVKAKKEAKKEIIAKVQNIRKIDNMHVIRWQIDDPKDTYVLQRTLTEWN